MKCIILIKGPTTINPDQNGYCLEGFKDLVTEGDYCYKMEYNTRTDSDPFAELWSEAEMSCNRLGATLASVHSPLENDGIKNYTDGLLTWIGLVGFSKLY